MIEGMWVDWWSLSGGFFWSAAFTDWRDRRFLSTVPHTQLDCEGKQLTLVRQVICVCVCVCVCVVGEAAAWQNGKRGLLLWCTSHIHLYLPAVFEFKVTVTGCHWCVCTVVCVVRFPLSCFIFRGGSTPKAATSEVPTGRDSARLARGAVKTVSSSRRMLSFTRNTALLYNTATLTTLFSLLGQLISEKKIYLIFPDRPSVCYSSVHKSSLWTNFWLWICLIHLTLAELNHVISFLSYWFNTDGMLESTDMYQPPSSWAETGTHPGPDCILIKCQHWHLATSIT